MNPGSQTTEARRQAWLSPAFAGLFGALMGLALAKFGNPPIMEKWVGTPTQFYEFVFGYPWPIAWAYWLLGLVGMAGVVVARWTPTAPRWLIALPLVWLLWELLAAAQSVNAELSIPTVKHYSACVLCFYLGLFSLSRIERPWPFWAGLTCGFLLVLKVGWEQHFGGLEESRRYFFLYEYPQMKQVPPEYLKRISSPRIFSTLFYPNALAGVVLLLLPVTLAWIWQEQQRLTAAARGFLVITVGAAGLACLYWSGSKGGWLLMLLLGLVAALRLPLSRRIKLALIAGVLLAGLAGFFWKHSGFFQKGATSVSARFDYWRAALHTARMEPVFGTGPGTFAIAYAKIKRPESEMARLVHNDYLEQASDSGLAGLAAYALFIAGALAWSFRNGLPPPRLATYDLQPHPDGDWLRFSVWLGVLGWSLQGFFEFGLYIPALAWPAFAFLGWLLGSPQMASTSPNHPAKVPEE